jgi:hypothetical protein
MKKEALDWAVSQIGQKELPNNGGFRDPVLDMLMRRVGFQDGYAWCALFAEACYSYPQYEGKSKVLNTISDCFSANAVRSYENFKNDTSGYFVVDNKQAVPGSIVIWEKKKNGDAVKNGVWTIGHAGIVEEVHDGYFIAIEGNGNSSGGREGIEVVRKQRDYNQYSSDGLCLKGFITPTI